MELRTVKKDQIFLSPFQRPQSPALVKKLEASISQLGFLVPLILVPIDEELAEKLNCPDKIGAYLLIDGQHRYWAGVHSGMEEFPSVITDKKALNFPLHLNTEKPDNIKDKANKIYNLYLYAVRFAPEVSESEAFSPTLSEEGPHIIPISFALKEKALKSPSLLEDFAKRVFAFYDLPLPVAMQNRRQEAELLAQLEKALNSVAESNGISDFILKKTMLSIALKDLYGEAQGKRTLINITDPFEDAVPKIVSQLASRDWSFLRKDQGV